MQVYVLSYRESNFNTKAILTPQEFFIDMLLDKKKQLFFLKKKDWLCAPEGSNWAFCKGFH